MMWKKSILLVQFCTVLLILSRGFSVPKLENSWGFLSKVVISLYHHPKTWVRGILILTFYPWITTSSYEKYRDFLNWNYFVAFRCIWFLWSYCNAKEFWCEITCFWLFCLVRRKSQLFMDLELWRRKMSCKVSFLAFLCKNCNESETN